MGFFDLVKRLGSGLNDVAQDFSQFQTDTADFNKFGPDFRQERQRQEMMKRLQLESAQNTVEKQGLEFERATRLNEKEREEEKRSRLGQEAKDAALSKYGTQLLAANSDPADDNASPEEARRHAIFKNAEADLEEENRKRETGAVVDDARQSTARLTKLQTEDRISNFSEDTSREREQEEIRSQLNEERLRSAQRSNDIGDRFDNLFAAQRAKANELSIKNSGNSPKSRNKSAGTLLGFENREKELSELFSSMIEDEFSARMFEEQASIEALSDLTGNGRIGLVNEMGNPMSGEDLKAIRMAASEGEIPVAEAAKAMGFRAYEQGKDIVTPQQMRNAMLQLQQGVTEPRRRLMEGRDRRVFDSLWNDFSERFYSSTLDKATRGAIQEMTDEDYQAITMIINKANQYIGQDRNAWPDELRRAIESIVEASSTAPVGR